MRPTDIARLAFGRGSRADVADAADTHVETSSPVWRSFADRCGYILSGQNVRKIPQQSANPATRMDAGDPLYPQVPQFVDEWNNPPTQWVGIHRATIAPESMERAIDWLNWFSNQGIAVEAESSGALHLLGLDGASPDVWQAAQALLICHANELRMALKAEAMAAASIRKAAEPCGGCRRLRHVGYTPPTCANGHRLVWRNGSTRRWPGRIDAKRGTNRKESK